MEWFLSTITEAMRNTADNEFKHYCGNIKTGILDAKTINYFQQIPNYCDEEEQNENFQSKIFP